jgi:Mg-chelatase subunit ChlD
MTIKIKRAGCKSAHVVMILDESSSMTSCWDETIAGANAFITKQQQSTVSTELTLVTFNGSTIKRVVSKTLAKEVKPLSKESYRPNGMTNLLDAIGVTIEEINAELVTLKREYRPSIEICILTDGEENMSKRYTVSALRELISQCEAKDWTFTFVGANIDAFAEGAKLGFGKQNTYQYDTSNMLATMSTMAARTESVKLARSAGMSTSAVYANTELTNKQRDDLTQ